MKEKDRLKQNNRRKYFLLLSLLFNYFVSATYNKQKKINIVNCLSVKKDRLTSTNTKENATTLITKQRQKNKLKSLKSNISKNCVF